MVADVVSGPSDAVAEAFESQVERAIGSVHDFKSELQERLAQRGELVVYRVVNEEGPPHDRMFETVAEVGGDTLGTGSGRSKKESEQEAARTALATLDDRGRAPAPKKLDDAYARIIRDAAIVWDALTGELPEGWERANVDQAYIGADGGCIGVETRLTIGLPQDEWCPCEVEDP